MEDAGPLFRVERGRRDKDQDIDGEVDGGGLYEGGEWATASRLGVVEEGSGDVLDALLGVDHVADHDHAPAVRRGRWRSGDVQLELRVPVQADEGIKHAENQYRDDGGGHLYSEGGDEAGRNHKHHGHRGNGHREHHDGLKEDEEDGDAIVAPGDLQGLGDKEGEVGHGRRDPLPPLFEELVHALGAAGVVLGDGAVAESPAFLHQLDAQPAVLAHVFGQKLTGCCPLSGVCVKDAPKGTATKHTEATRTAQDCTQDVLG